MALYELLPPYLPAMQAGPWDFQLARRYGVSHLRRPAFSAKQRAPETGEGVHRLGFSR